MRSLRRLVVNVLMPLCVAGVSSVSRPVFAQQVGVSEDSEEIDDPKLARRLGARVELAPSAATAPAGAAPPLGPGGIAAVPTGGAAPPSAVEAPPPAGQGEAPPLAQGTEPRTPRMKLAYRRFVFAQVGATAMAGPGASEPFDVLSVDFYPVSSEWRFGLTTQYGWEEGTFRQGGDAFIAQSVSLGGQIPGHVFTPFLEAYAGGGYMQRTHAGLNSVATAYGQLGVDLGTELFLARHFCLSAAIGYIHAGNGFVKDATFGSFSVDAFSFKLGVGL